MEKIFANKFTDQIDLVKNYLLPEIKLFQIQFNLEINSVFFPISQEKVYTCSGPKIDQNHWREHIMSVWGR